MMMENVVIIHIIIKKNILRLLRKTGLESKFSDPVFFILLKIWIYFKSLHNVKKQECMIKYKKIVLGGAEYE